MLADSSPTTMSVHTPLTVKKSPTPPPLNFDWSYLFNVWTTLTPHLSSKTGQLSKRTFCSFWTITTRINTLNIHYTTSKQKPPTTCFNISPTFAPLSSNWLAEEKSPLIMSFCKKNCPAQQRQPPKVQWECILSQIPNFPAPCYQTLLSKNVITKTNNAKKCLDPPFQPRALWKEQRRISNPRPH